MVVLAAYFGPAGDGQRRWCGDCCAMHPGAVDVREYAVLARLLVVVLKVEDTEGTAEKAARCSEEDKAARVARKAVKDAARAAAVGGDQPSGGAAEGARAAGLPWGPAVARRRRSGGGSTGTCDERAWPPVWQAEARSDRQPGGGGLFRPRRFTASHGGAGGGRAGEAPAAGPGAVRCRRGSRKAAAWQRACARGGGRWHDGASGAAGAARV